MAAIHSRDTKPELLVRRYLFACGFRYRLNSPRLPGHPDLVLRKYRTCIFVNGCFWHGHDCGAFRLPKTNTDFWQRKINRNRQRDVEVQQRLAAMGWHSITVWGCELTKKRYEQTLQSLELTLHRIYLQDLSILSSPTLLTPLTPISPLTPPITPFPKTPPPPTWQRRVSPKHPTDKAPLLLTPTPSLPKGGCRSHHLLPRGGVSGANTKNRNSVA